MTVNESDATLAVASAAKSVYETNRAASAETFRRSGLPEQKSWEELDPLTQNTFRNAVLPIVWATLEAIPDRDRGLWLEGYYAHECGIHEEACPYPLV